MNELIEFLTSKEIIVVYVVAGIACLLYFVIYLAEKNYYKRKRRQNTRELNRLVEEINATLQEENKDLTVEEKVVETYETPVITAIEELPELNKQEVISEEINELPKVEIIEKDSSEIPEILEQQETLTNVEDIILETMYEPLEVESLQEQSLIEEIELLEQAPVMKSEKEEYQTKVIEPITEELTYTEIEPNREEAQAELLKLTEELEKAEQEVRNIDLTAYEEEQEENAIISLEELVKKSKEMYQSNEVTQYADEGNEPISLADLELRMQATKKQVEEPVMIEKNITELTKEEPVLHQEQLVLDDFNTVTQKLNQEVETTEKPLYQTTKKFQTSPVISPIYGIERKDITTEMELENTANYEKLDEEIKKTNEFLMTLRELQKHLD